MASQSSIERRVVSILFADLVGFTSLAEGLDAEEVAAIQDGYFSAVREVVARYGGQLEKFIGDAAMAVFGVPRVREDDAERAVRAALALVHTVEGMAGAVGLDDQALQLRVGVNSGEVAYGADERGEWRVSGDAVNVAARLQAAADPGTVLVGDATALAVAETIALEAPRDLELKGKAEPVRAWRAASALAQRSRERAMGRLRAPLMGREKVFGRLQDMLARAEAGATEATLIVAPPGVGKTRLVEELARTAAQRSIAVWRARVVPETAAPTAAVAQLVLSGLGVEAAGAAARARELLLAGNPASTDMLAEIDRLLAPPAAGPETPALGAGLSDERSARFRSWVSLLDALSQGRPVLWLLEDLHWASRDLLAFVEYAGSARSPGGRLLLATARPSVAEMMTPAATLFEGAPDGATPRLKTLELPPLAAADTISLVSALVGDALPPDLVATLAERSDGNPLYVEELLRSWVSLGVLVDESDGWRLTAAPQALALPQTVQQVYAAQLDDLPAAARTLVRRGSVAGRVVPRRGLTSLEAPADEATLEIVGRRALMAATTPDPVVGPALSYRHVLLRDAGYASLARAERARLHVGLAEWYERAAGARAADVAEQIASHYGAALDNASRLSPHITAAVDIAVAHRRAAEWYERAADGALADAAHEAGRGFLSSALHHADAAAGADPLTRPRLLLRLGEVTAYSADMDVGLALLAEATALYRAAFEDAMSTDSPGPAGAQARSGLAEAAAAQARALIQQIRFEAAHELSDATLQVIGPPDDEGVARLLCIRGWARSTLTVDAAAQADVDRALAIAQALGDRRLELEVTDWRLRTVGELGTLTVADPERMERLAIDLGDWARATHAMRMRAAFLVDDLPGEVWPIMDASEQILRRHGTDEDLGWVDYMRSEAGFCDGDWERALECGLRAMDLAEGGAYHRVAVRTWHVLLPLAEARDDRALLERASAWYTAREGSFPDSPYGRIMEGAATVHFLRAGLWPEREVDPARRRDGLAVPGGGPSYVQAVETLVEHWLAAGLLAGVADSLAALEQALAADPDPSDLFRNVVELLHARLALAQAANRRDLADPSTAVERARAALAGFRRIGAPWWTFKVLDVLASAGSASAQEAEEQAEIAALLRISPQWGRWLPSR